MSLNFSSFDLPSDIFSKAKDVEYRIRESSLKAFAEKLVGDLEKGIFFLRDDEIEYLSKRGKKLTSLEEIQILFMYKYCNSWYVKNPERIDDNKLRLDTLKSNKKIKPILDNLSYLVEKYNLK